MALPSEPFHVHLETQHVLALRKAISIAVVAEEQLPEDERRMTWPERKWLAEVERQLWPGWRPAHERRYPPKP